MSESKDEEVSKSLLELPELPYSLDALEPHMSVETFEYHYEKHHQGYVNNGNALLKSSERVRGRGVEDIIRLTYADKKLHPIFNNVAQHWNHCHFWQWLSPKGGEEDIPGKLLTALEKEFNSYEEFKKRFIMKGFTQFGSGWVWLVYHNGRLDIISTANGENPIILGKAAILGCDVWEHSYYIDYRNDRRKYLETFLEELVNWEYVESLYEKVAV